MPFLQAIRTKKIKPRTKILALILSLLIECFISKERYFSFIAIQPKDKDSGEESKELFLLFLSFLLDF